MISVCIITKDEAKKLERCLKSLEACPIEVVAVDTGSTDETPALLEQWSARSDIALRLVLGKFSWCDDFSKARNYAASLASNDRILVLDSDEILQRMDLAALEQEMEEHPKHIGRLLIRDKLGQAGKEMVRTSRLSRSYDRRYCQYTGRIHEQITPIDGTSPAALAVDIPVEILHDGYMGSEELHTAKSFRNIRMLKTELDEQGDDPYLLYHLGKNFNRLREYEQAAEIFAKALSFDLNPQLEYVVDMVEAYGYALVNAGRAGVALGLESVYDVFGNTAEFRLMMGHVYMHNGMFQKAIQTFLSATECETSATEGLNSTLAYYNAAVVYEGMGDVENALALYKRCGEYAQAKNRISVLTSEK